MNNNSNSCWDSSDDLTTREERCRTGDPVTAHAETGLEASGWSLSTGDLCLQGWDSIITLLANSGPTTEVEEANFAWMDEAVALRCSGNHGQQGNSDRSVDPSDELLDPSRVDAAGAVKQSVVQSILSTAAQQFLDSLPDISYVLC
jgi:hypothetical protein